MKVYADAGYLTYLLDLFDGSLSLNDILSSDIALIMNMREAKEEQLKVRANAAKRASSPKSTISKDNVKSMDDIANMRGGFTKPIT